MAVIGIGQDFIPEYMQVHEVSAGRIPGSPCGSFIGRVQHAFARAKQKLIAINNHGAHVAQENAATTNRPTQASVAGVFDMAIVGIITNELIAQCYHDDKHEGKAAFMEEYL